MSAGVELIYFCPRLDGIQTYTLDRDVLAKYNSYDLITGLYKAGSKAVFHYNRTGLGDLFALMCAAFDQPLYKVDKELNIIE